MLDLFTVIFLGYLCKGVNKFGNILYKLCQNSYSPFMLKNFKPLFFILLTGMTFFTSCTSGSNGSNLATSQEEADFKAKCSRQYNEINISDFSDGFNHARYLYEDSIPPWQLYDTTQILGLAENMIYLQNPDGGWAKNLDFQRVYTLSELREIQNNNKSVPPVTYQLHQSQDGSTMDNRNIYSQLKYLCQVYRQVPDQRYLDCAVKAFTWILNAQHPTSGGFTGADVFAITFNDNVMSDVLTVLRDIANAGSSSYYYVLPVSQRKQAETAYKKGINCILKTQITVTLKDNTKLKTAWCQQHSHDTFAPVWAREFEPPSICSSESFSVLKFLMNDPSPTEQIKAAVKAGVEFFDRDDVRIHGKELKQTPIQATTLNGRTYTYDQTLVDNPSAPDMWARFYALDKTFDVVTGARKPIQGNYPEVLSPVWCDRGCIYYDDYNKMSMERRNGYSYVNSSFNSTLSKYNQWKQNFPD